MKSHNVEYFTWITSRPSTDKIDLRKFLAANNNYPLSITWVNGALQIAFSGNPNHYTDHVENTINRLMELLTDSYGQVVWIDHDFGNFFKADIVNGVIQNMVNTKHNLFP